MLAVDNIRISALADDLTEPINQLFLAGADQYAWSVTDNAWRKLNTGFDHTQFNSDAARNIALRNHLERVWATSSIEQKFHLASWIIKDWGGINRNKPSTIRHHVNVAESSPPLVRFAGIASLTKVLAVKSPNNYAIYDSRVAAALNAIQLINPTAFGMRLPVPKPNGEKSIVVEFRQRLETMSDSTPDLIVIEPDDCYEIYLKLLNNLRESLSRSILELEMCLFGAAPSLCSLAMTNSLVGTEAIPRVQR